VTAVVGLQRVQDRGQMAVELHVDDRADDLGDFAGLGHFHLLNLKRVETIS